MYHTLIKKRGRQPPEIGGYCCTGCAHDKPTVRDGVHVACSKCGAPPNDQLARLWNLPEWPRVITSVPDA